MGKREKYRKIKATGDGKPKVKDGSFSAQLTIERAWPPFLFNVKMCAGTDKKSR